MRCQGKLPRQLLSAYGLSHVYYVCSHPNFAIMLFLDRNQSLRFCSI